MLIYLHILNFAIIEKLELDFRKGLTVITGETGAGKSIIIDALSLILGNRADISVIRHEQEKCELTACFDLTQVHDAKKWLITQDYHVENDECVLRRILYRDGRSKLSINGSACSLTQVKEFANFVINIHSQNQQQSLLKKSYQRELLDNFGGLHALTERVLTCFNEWSQIDKQYHDVQSTAVQSATQIELLTYQIAELDKLAVTDGEYEQLDQEQKQLAQAEHLIQVGQHALDLLGDADSFNALHSLYQSTNCLQPLTNHHVVQPILECLQTATIQIEEAISSLRHFLQKIEINPERLLFVEQRIAKIHELARKHQVIPKELCALHQDLNHKLSELTGCDERLVQLKNQLEQLRTNYFCTAAELSLKRSKTAIKLNKSISAKIKELGMPGGFLQVELLTKSDPHPCGLEEIEFYVTANPGQPLQPLNKVASGGEISRIALAIYVVTAQLNTTPVLIFDEVDVGIGGQVAAIVGQLLRSLANDTQVICITHLPQVAAQGNQHLKVIKAVSANQTTTELSYLDGKEKVAEIARMLGGVTITKKTLDHAQEMLEWVE